MNASKRKITIMSIEDYWLCESQLEPDVNDEEAANEAYVDNHKHDDEYGW